MFMGEYNHSIDTKNRVIIPSKFREQLGDSFVVSCGLDGCLYLCTYEDWETFIGKLRELPYTKETRDLQRFFGQNSTIVDTDKQGRVLIPQNLKAMAGIDKDIVFVGAISKVELWAKERLNSNTPDETMESIVDKLSTQYGLRF